MPLITYTLVFLAAIGTLFGLGLAFAAKKFSVIINPKVEQVKEVLAQAH
jgi:electron transport complex protein RnfB